MKPRRIRWWAVLLGGGLVVGAASILEPLLGPFDELAALVTLGSFVAIGFLMTKLLKLSGR
jgi:hypothetical protein